MADLAGIDVVWADDEDGPKVYLTIPTRSVALTVEQAHDLDREIGGCLSEIRWHLARWVMVDAWGKPHLCDKDGYSDTATAICGRGPDARGSWDHETPIQTLTAFDMRDLCRRCLKLYRAAAERKD